MQRFVDHIFAYYDSLPPIGSAGITKSLKVWLNNPKCGQKEGGKFPFFVEITMKANPPIFIYKSSYSLMTMKYYFFLGDNQAD